MVNYQAREIYENWHPPGEYTWPHTIFGFYQRYCLKSARCGIFADDVVIYISHKNLEHLTNKLQNGLNELSTWYNDNRLKINIDKTKVLLFKSSSSDNLNIFIDDTQIEQVKSIRYLYRCRN